MPRVRIDGGLIGVTNNPTSGSAGGMWSFSEHSKYTRSASWPAASAPANSLNAIVAMIGGGGGSTSGTSSVNFGAGGAGGVLRYANSYIITNNPSISYTVTVGAGGAGIATGTPGSGSNSAFSASAVIATGGDGAPSSSKAGANNADFSGAAAPGGTGAGGGAGAGANGSGTTGGAGANIAISGTFTSYGGGGGGIASNAASGIGGAGGGGNGNASGTAGTGGGAGGGTYNGGSGIVMINYPAPQQFTGGTVTNVNNLAGSNIVHTFTTSGSLNALGYSIDTYFPQTTLLLHGDGTVGANNTVFLDSSGANTYIPFNGTYSNYFNGSTTYLTASSSTAFNQDVNFTIEFWFYALGLPATNDAKFWMGPGLAPALASTGRIVVDDQTTGNVMQSSSVISLNTWYHVAVVRTSSTNARLYLNGVQQQSITFTNWLTGSGVTIGKRVDTGEIFNGYISNMRFVRGTAVYTSAFTPPTTPLTAITNTTFLSCQSPRFIDNSTNNFTITQVGNPAISAGGPAIAASGKPLQGTFSPFSQTGWSNYFDGTGDYHTIAQNAAFAFGTGDYTIEAWIWKNDTGRQVGIVDTRGASTGGVLFYLTSAGYLTAFDGTSSYIGNSAATLVTPYVWHHVAITRSSGTTTLFIDGISVASISGDTRNNTNGAGGTLIARQFGSTTSDFNGYISNVRIINGTAQYTSNFIPSIAPLTAITNTQLLACQDNRFKDNSTNAFTVTPSGTPSVQPFSPFAPSSAYSNTTVSGSISFNGSTDYLSGSGDPFGALTGNFTVEFWVYKNDAWSASSQMIFDAGASSSMGVWVNTGSGTLRMSRSGVDAPIEFSYSTLAPKQWYHIVFVRSGTTLSMYINGTRVNSVTSSASFAAGTTYNIGRNTAASQYWNGYISNFRAVKGSAVYDPNLTTLTVPTSPLTAVASTSLLLNTTNAGIIDHTAKNNITTYGSAAISSTQSKFGGTSVSFNGSSDFITGPSSQNLLFRTGDFTVEFWLYLNFATNAGGLVGTWSGTNSSSGWLVSQGFTNTSALRFGTSDGTNATFVESSAGALTTGTWLHCAVARASSTLRMFVNGSQVYSASNSADINTLGNISIGAVNNGSFYSNCYLDDIRITKGIARYTSNFTPPTSTFLDR